MSQYILQNRWKMEGNYLVYYGIRKKPFTTINKIKLNNNTKKLIENLASLSNINIQNKAIKNLIDNKILVTESEYKKTPTSFDEAIFCIKCIANDFMLPGIEFDEDGLCPMCANERLNQQLKSVTPVINTIPKSKKGRFDIAVFYTGGKDSTYLLYYFAKVLNMKVLALTWEIPFISLSAKLSIENAKKHLPNVEFVNRYVSPTDLEKIYSSLYQSQLNTCCCPNLAYMLFYPTLVYEKIPYLVVGNEPVQMLGLYYNNIAPKIAYSIKAKKALRIAINTLRILTLRKPLKLGQFEMLATIKQLVYGPSKLVKLTGYQNELLDNIDKSLKEVPQISKTLKKTYKRSKNFGFIPRLIHVDFNDISPNGIYEWTKVKDTLVKEVGFILPAKTGKLLHTSCKVELAKDYSQFIRFYHMKSKIMPFSAIEISLASASKNIAKEEALKELKTNLGFTLQRPKEHQMMEECFNCLGEGEL